MNKEYGSVQIEIPEPHKSSIQEYAKNLINISHTQGPLTDPPHITVQWGLDNSVEEIAKIIGTFIPIRVMFGHTNIFIADDYRDTDVVKLEVYGESIRRMRRKLVPVVQIYKSYSPHITLGYVEKGTGMYYIGNNPFIGDKIICKHVVFSAMNGKKYKITHEGEISDYA